MATTASKCGVIAEVQQVFRSAIAMLLLSPLAATGAEAKADTQMVRGDL